MRKINSIWLVYGAAAFQAYHMGRAFHVYDPNGWQVFNVNVGGLILGAILNVIVAQTAVRLPSLSGNFETLKALMPTSLKKADQKQEQARSRALKKMTVARKQNAYSQVGYAVLLGFSTLMVAPALYILWMKTLPFHPIFIGFMAAVGAVAPDVAITVGGISSNDAERRSTPKPATVSVVPQRAPSLKARSATKEATVSETPAALYRCVCGYTDENRFRYSGHTRACSQFKAHKAALNVIPVDLSVMPAQQEVES